MWRFGISLLAATVLASACGGGGNGKECDQPDQCSSGVCLTLSPNKQNKTGICSAECTLSCESEDDACVSTGAQSFCFQRCETSSDCSDGFICFEDINTSVRVCLVEPN